MGGKSLAGAGLGHIAAVQHNIAPVAESGAPTLDLPAARDKSRLVQYGRTQTNFSVRAVGKNMQGVHLPVSAQKIAQNRKAVGFRVQPEKYGIRSQVLFNLGGVPYRSVDDKNLHGGLFSDVPARIIRCQIFVMDKGQAGKLDMHAAIVKMIHCVGGGGVEQKTGFQLEKRVAHECSLAMSSGLQSGYFALMDEHDMVREACLRLTFPSGKPNVTIFHTP